MEPIEKLREYLARIPSGRVTDTRELEARMASCWDQFKIRDGGSGSSAELAGRLQQALWHPPILKVIVGTALENSPGCEQRWEINLDRQTVTLSKLPQPLSRSQFNMGGIVDQIVRITIERRQDSRLRWYSDGSVRIAVGAIFPEGVGFKQTISSRRRKFRLALDEKLTVAGWRRVKDYVYAPPPP